MQRTERNRQLNKDKYDVVSITRCAAVRVLQSTRHAQEDHKEDYKHILDR